MDRTHVTAADLEEAEEYVENAAAKERTAQAALERLDAATERSRLEAELAIVHKDMARLREVRLPNILHPLSALALRPCVFAQLCPRKDIINALSTKPSALPSRIGFQAIKYYPCVFRVSLVSPHSPCAS